MTLISARPAGRRPGGRARLARPQEPHHDPTLRPAARGEMVIQTTSIAGQNIITLTPRKGLMKTIKLLRHDFFDTKNLAANLRKELPGNSQDLHDDIHIAMAYKIAAGGAKGDSLWEDAGIFNMAILVDENAEEKPMVERGGFSTSFLMKHAHPTMRTEAIGRVRS